MDQTSQVENLRPDIPPKSSNTRFKIVGIIAILLAIFGIYFAMASNQNRQAQTSETSPTGPAVTSFFKVTYVPPSKWKTYTNSVVGYSVEVPDDWVVNDQKGVFINIPGEVAFTTQAQKNNLKAAAIYITAMSTNTTRYSINSDSQYREWLAKSVLTGIGERLYKVGQLKVDGNEAIKFTSRSLPGDTKNFYSIITWFRKNNTNYYFEVSGDNIDLVKSADFTQTYNRILSTFKFNK